MKKCRKIQASDILIPGARLVVKKINWDDPENKKFVESVRSNAQKSLNRKNKDWSQLYAVVNR